MRRSRVVVLCHEKVLQVVAEWAQVLNKRYQPGFISRLAAPYPARKVRYAGAAGARWIRSELLFMEQRGETPGLLWWLCQGLGSRGDSDMSWCHHPEPGCSPAVVPSAEKDLEIL